MIRIKSRYAVRGPGLSGHSHIQLCGPNNCCFRVTLRAVDPDTGLTREIRLDLPVRTPVERAVQVRDLIIKACTEDHIESFDHLTVFIDRIRTHCQQLSKATPKS